jgi:hypothetical protein
MQESPRVTRGVIGVRKELAKIGLTPEVVEESIRSGESYRELCTPNDPKIFHGTTAWARTMRRLREELIEDDWTAEEPSNFPLIVSPNGRMAIAVTTGDKGTGIYLPGQSPKLKHTKGPMARSVVKQNRQSFLFQDMAADAKEKADKAKTAEKRITWFLLVRREGDVVFAELSLPWVFSDSGQVEDWRRRIILDPLQVEPTIMVVDDTEEAEPVEVTVTKKS